jgi:hypothetical protein
MVVFLFAASSFLYAQDNQHPVRGSTVRPRTNTALQI